jgi:hypothetical protein
VQLCYIDYWEKGPWIDHLMRSVPPEMRQQVRFRAPHQMRVNAQGVIVYPQNTGAIQIRPPTTESDGQKSYLVLFWHHGADPSGLAPFEAWFWKESRRFFRRQAAPLLEKGGPDGNGSAQSLDPDGDGLWHWKESHRLFQNEVAERAKALGPTPSTAGQLVPSIDARRKQLEGGDVDIRSSIAAALVIFALFFACIYTLPSLTCEERERGILLAQALSPASPMEILAAKFLFYPTLGVALAVILAGIYKPSVLVLPFFWLAVGVSACGFLGVGMTIGSLARTQREASMGALCYLLAVTLLLFICQQNNVPLLPQLALEFHCPRILQASLAGSILFEHWAHLGGAALLAVAWALVAAYLFRRRGWQ